MSHSINTFSTWRIFLKDFFEKPVIHIILGSLIALNLVTLGLETSPTLMASYGHWIVGFNNSVLLLFALEVSLRLCGEGPKFFQSGWNIFDFVVVFVALIAFGSFLQVFRGLRILWLLRTLTITPQFRHLVDSIVRALPGLLSVMCLLILAIYIAALIGTVEFAHTVPELFGSIPKSMATLTQTILMEHTWSERYAILKEHHPMAWTYVFPVMIILNYLLLHLVLGVIVNALHRQYEEDEHTQKSKFLEKLFKKEHHTLQNPLSPDTKAILQSLEEMKSMLRR